MSKSYSIEVLPSPILQVGKGPHWDVATQSLYFNDIYGEKSSIHRYDYATNKTYSASIAGEPVVSFIIPVDGTTDQFAVGIGRRIGIVRWDGVGATAVLLRIAVEVDAKHANNRFNDGKADPAGRFFGGTMRLEACGDIYEAADGSLYSYAKDAPLVVHKTNIGCSNGMAWNVPAGKFYYVDTCASDIKEFDYDVKTGKTTNERVLIDFHGANGARSPFGPDSMTIDTEGFLYLATWGGSKILRIDPRTRKVVLTIEMPAEQITSSAFGGPNLDELFVTSAAQARVSPQPEPAGRLFKIKGLGVRGLPMNKVRL